MNDERIFHDALNITDPEQRRAYLDTACAGNVRLREDVEALLRAHDEDQDFLRQPALAQVGSPARAAADPGRTAAPGPAQGTDDLGYLDPPSAPGSLGRLGPYEILQTLGKGSFGTVFRAQDDTLHRVVAVKVLSPLLAGNATARKRFLREARAAAAVVHDHVITIHGVDEAHGVPYIVMQLVDGVSLEEKLRRTGPLTVEQVLRIGAQTAEGLAAAHRQGLVHRDIKPANILLENGVERVKITDFGLARAVDDASLTQSGVIAGTPQYMSPEQAAGGGVDARSDLFSLGSVLYAMCTGRPPFRGRSALSVLRRVADDEPRPVRELAPGVPDWLEAIIARLHAKRAEDRFASAAEVADLLRGHLAHLQDPLRVRQPAPVGMARPPRARRRRATAWWVWLLILPLILVPCTGLLFLAVMWVSLTPVRVDSGPAVPVAVVEARAFGEQEGGWQELFNGRDLAGWKTHPGHPGGWEVRDGVLVGSHGPALLYSDRGDYENFDLRAELRISPGGAGGLFLRSGFGPKAGLAAFDAPDGLETHIAAGERTRLPTGTISFDGRQVGGKAETPADRWFTLEVSADGPRITTRVLGEETPFMDEVGRRVRGHLAVGVFDPETVVQIRSIQIREKPASGGPAERPFPAEGRP